MNEMTKKLIEAVKRNLTPSLGVTEPGAIAYAAACASRAVGGRPKRVSVRLNSCIYKNSFTCAVPGTDGMGCALAAALGAVAGDPAKKLMATDGATDEQIKEAKLLPAKAELESVSPDIFIEATVETVSGIASAVIEGRHDRLTRLTVNGKDIPVEAEKDKPGESFRVSSASFRDILECVGTAEGLEFLDEAVNMNMGLFKRGKRAGLIPLTASRVGSADSCRELAELYTCGAIEARVRGANAPAMAITGSGSHGILCFIPVHTAAEYSRIPRERERRALLLSALVTMYIKENSGLLSAACGCVLAGGTGAALGLTYLYSEDDILPRLSMALNSMAASVTGMICHGGNTGCSLKASIGVNMAFSAAEMAVSGFGAESVHGILGPTPEDTMRNMGRIARDMLPVENTILDIMKNKEI